MEPLDPHSFRVNHLLAISQKLAANLTLTELLHHIVQVAADLTNSESAGILLCDEASNNLRFVAVTQHTERLYDIPVPLDASIAGVAFIENQPVIVDEVETDPRYYPKVAEILKYPAYSILAVPLTFCDQKIGVLEAENKKAEARFDETDADLLMALAAQAAIAIEHARQLERYQHLAQAEQSQRQMAEAMREASAVLACTLDYDEVIDRILEQIRAVIPSDACNLMMIEVGEVARVFRGQGYDKFGTAETLDTIKLNINEVVGLRQMIETRQPILIPDVTQDPTWIYSRPEHRWIRAYIGTPIITPRNIVGFLNTMSATPNMYDRTHVNRLQVFAHHAAIAIENARLYRQAQEEIAARIAVEEELRHHRDHLEELVKERTAEIARLAITDPLTGLFNRRHLMELGVQAFNQARRYQRPLTVMLIDMDHFKWINDTYGHEKGDETLQKLAGLLQRSLRTVDTLGRYGGEEFVILMPETEIHAAQQMAERLRADLHDLYIPVPDGELHLTASLGLAEYHPVYTQTLNELINLADQAMYKAKQAGRDRVVTHLH